MASLKSDKNLGPAVETAARFIDLIPVRCIVAGSIRRRKPVVGDIDIVSAGCFPRHVDGAEFISGQDTLRTYLFEDTQINVMIAQPEYFGATLLYATGSGKWGWLLRARAKKKGYKLNRYGLWDRDSGILVASRTEREIFNALGKNFVSPECRV